jgi:hypothetical protein
MIGVRSRVAKLACIPVLALLSVGGCVAPANDDAAYYRMQALMGWNPEMQQALLQRSALFGIILAELGVLETRTGRNPYEAFHIGFHHHH